MHFEHRPLRIGAVRYLNARPLTCCLQSILPRAELELDLPSRLADRLAAGSLDVAMIPSVETLRIPGCRFVSDACIASRGPVKSVKLYGRKPPGELSTLALDEGSRTSAALVQILLRGRYGRRPAIRSLPLGSSVADSDADAVLLIGDRGMLEPEGQFAFVWDLAEQWRLWTGLPFVFAAWVAAPGVPSDELAAALSAARDEGLRHLAAIARLAAPEIGVPESECLAYLRDHLTFRLGAAERSGLETFFRLVVEHGLAEPRRPR